MNRIKRKIIKFILIGGALISIVLVAQAQDTVRSQKWQIENPNIEIIKFGEGELYEISGITEGEFLSEYPFIQSAFNNVNLKIQSPEPLLTIDDVKPKTSFFQRIGSVFGRKEKISSETLKKLELKKHSLNELNFNKKIDRSHSIEKTIDLSELSIKTFYTKKEDGGVKQKITLYNKSEKDRELVYTQIAIINTNYVRCNNESYFITKNPLIFGENGIDCHNLEFHPDNDVFSRAEYDWEDISSLNTRVSVFREGISAYILARVTLLIPAQGVFILDPSWYNSSWSYRKKLIATSSSAVIPSTQTNFPMLVNLGSDSDLASKAQEDGDDILFTSSDGVTKIDHEIESYASSTGALIAWVEVPSLSTSTEIYMYYGNGSVGNQQNVGGTWDSYFKGVWHMTGATSTAIDDSTSNNNDVTTQGGDPTYNQTGRIAKAVSFDGDQDYLQVNHSTTLEPGDSEDFTAEAWIKTSADSTMMCINKRENGGTYPGWFLYLSYSNPNARPVISIDEGATSTNSILSEDAADGTWQYLVGVRSGSDLKIYRNAGTPNSTSTIITGSLASGANLVIGIGYDETNYDFNGEIDEVRFSKGTARSANWITSSYHSMNNPSGFYSLGSEESNSPPSFSAGPTDGGSSGTSPTDEGTNVTFSATSTDTEGDSWKLLVCSTSSAPTASSSVPECAGGAGNRWCVSSSWASSSAMNNCTYAAASTDSESNTWWAFVCDNNSSAANCSSTGSQGSGDNGSPFKVNHKPSFGWSVGGNGYKYRKKLIATSSSAVIPSTQTNFPMLVNLGSDSDLASKAQEDGDDILFTSSDGVTKIDHEIESYASSTGALIAWVEVPSLSTSTEIYMYYGNGSVGNQQNVGGTWDSYFKGVWHMSDETTSTITDSTDNNNDGSKKGANEPVATTTAKTNEAQDFDGIDDYISMGNVLGFERTDSFSIEGWVKYASQDAAILVAKQEVGSDYRGYSIFVDSDPLDAVTIYLSNDNSPANRIKVSIANPWDDNAWHYFAITYNGSSLASGIKFYVDDSSQTLTTNEDNLSATILNSANLQIGARGGTNCPIDGLIDEVRISNSARSADWITSSYHSMNNPSGFYSLGNEEIYFSDSPDPIDAGSVITFSFMASDSDTDTATDTVALLICKTAGISGTACDGGANDSWCTLTSATSSNPSCTTTASGIGSQDYYAYIFDNHTLGAAENGISGSFTINNATPTVGSITPGAISLVENSTTTATSSCTVTDNNGYEDLASVIAILYDSNATNSSCGADNNTCYPSIACATSSCSSNQCNASCSADVWYYANASDGWEWEVTATDDGALSGNNTSATTTVTSLIALDVAESTIDYGSLNLGATSSQATTTVVNTGNVSLDSFISGTDMTCQLGSIVSTQQHYSTSTGFSWADGGALSTSPASSSLDLPQRTSGSVSDYIYWLLKIPDTGAGGSCTGTNTIEAATDF